MPKIILLYPFIVHHAGSVFQLSDEVGIQGWDEDERVRDRISTKDKEFYTLPDDGKGRVAELLLYQTHMCPESLFDTVDIKSGPCRITSISFGLENPGNDLYYISPFPEGRGLLKMLDSEKMIKNRICFEMLENVTVQQIIIVNRVSKEMVKYRFSAEDRNSFSFDEFDPGFYAIELNMSDGQVHTFTMIKCFPLVIHYDEKRQSYTTSKSIW